MRQLGYWDRIGFFSPQYADENRRAFSRIYSFRDVVGLRTLSLLRNKHGVSLQELQKVGNWLKERYEAPWSSLKFYVWNRRVYFQEPGEHHVVAGRPLGQGAFPIFIREIEQEVENEAKKLRERSPSEIGQVSRNRFIAQNAPILSGTRIPTSAIWSLHEAGYNIEEIIQEYPILTPDDVRVAISHEEAQRRQAV